MQHSSSQTPSFFSFSPQQTERAPGYLSAWNPLLVENSLLPSQEPSPQSEDTFQAAAGHTHRQPQRHSAFVPSHTGRADALSVLQCREQVTAGGPQNFPATAVNSTIVHVSSRQSLKSCWSHTLPWQGSEPHSSRRAGDRREDAL